MINPRILFLSLCALIFVCTNYSKGQLVLYEDFNYPPPAYIGGNGNAGSSSNNWTTHSVTTGQTTTIDIINGNLTYPGLAASSGYKAFSFGNNNATSRDINRAISTTSTVLYYSVLINIIDNSGLTASGDYFMHFGATAGLNISTFGGCINAKAVNAGLNYRISIKNTSISANPNTEFPQDLNFGTTYLLVVKYDRATSPTTAYLWVNPTSLGGSEPSGSVSNSVSTPAFLNFASICIRNSASTPKLNIDEIRVGTTWADVTPTSSVISSINLNSPNGGENLIPGTTHNITWSSSNIQDVKIELTTNNGANWLPPISSSYPAASGSYSWTVPNYNSTDCKIRISDVSNPDRNDVSNNTFTITSNPLNLGLVAYYPFNGNANDASGNNNHGVQMYGSATFESGLNGQCAKFGGYYNPGHIKVANSPSLQVTTGMSISLWFRLDDPGGMNGYGGYDPYGGGCVFAKSHDRSGYLSKTGTNSQNVFGIGFDNNYFGSNNFSVAGTVSGYTLKTWKHVVFIISTTSAKCYIDGQLRNSVNINNFSFAVANGQDLYFGKFSDSWYPVNGALDEVKIYNRPISENEVQLLYNQVAHITLNSPNGTEQWKPGEKRFITWNYANINQVKIELSTNNGTNWYRNITTQQASNNSYEWTIPNDINSTQCKIKISDNSNPGVFDVSDGVFSITPQVQNNVLLNFKVIDPFGTARKLKFIVYSVGKIPGTDIEREDYFVNTFYNNIINSSVQLNKETISSFITQNQYQIRDIEILDQYDSYIGHIKFKYNRDSLLKENRTDALIILDEQYTAYQTGKLEHKKWNYCRSVNDKMVYMLIPPGNKFENINPLKKPALFVHGIYGFYPYWGADMVNSLYINGFDTWQFYYPYDQYNYYSGQLLRKSISKILNEGGPIGSFSGRYLDSVYIVAHSMGGLVARSYIQDLSYKKDIKKLMMLGTPNHGSYSAYRVSHEFSTGLIGSLFGKDPDSPAHSDLKPASDWLFNLNYQDPKQLQENIPFRNSYFVVAGTEKEVPANLHNEIENQDDGVVAVSSASMLNYNIPLATIFLKHTKLPIDVPPQMIMNYFNSSYKPEFNNPNVNTIKAYSSGLIIDTSIAILKWDGTVNKTKGIICLKSSNIKSDKNLYFIDENTTEQTRYRLSMNDLSFAHKISFFKAVDNENYFSLNKISYNGIGIFSNANPNKSFVIGIEQRKPWSIFHDYFEITRDYSFSSKPLQTTMIVQELDEEDAFNLKSKSNLKRKIAKNNGFDKQKGNNMSLNIFYVDSSSDTISFYLLGTQSDTNFYNNNFTLISPNGTTIDSAYCSSQTGYKYKQIINNKFVRYYIINPQSGNWTAQYNSALTDAELFVPILSPITASVDFKDTSYISGDTLLFTVPLPTPIDYTNIQITATMDFTPRNTDSTLNLGNVSVTQLNDTTYGGRFISTRPGVYTANLVFTCLKSGETIERHTAGYTSVISIAPPVLDYPPQDTTKIPVNLVLKWKPTKFATRYSLQVFPVNDTIAIAEEMNITDTTYYLDSLLNNSTYIWRIKSLNATDTSEWSELSSFTTIVSAPAVSLLSSPPDNSGGIVSPVTLKWLNTSRAEKYHLMVSTDTSFTNIVINDSTVTDTLKVLTNLDILTYYYWKVRAVNDGGKGDFSQRWAFRTMGLPVNTALIQPADTTINQPVVQAFRWSRSYDRINQEKSRVLNKFSNELKSNTESPGVRKAGKRITQETNSTENVYCYWFEMVNDTNTMSGLQCDSLVSDTVKIISGLNRLSVYYWRVKPKNEAGWGSFTKWNRFSTIRYPDISVGALPLNGQNSTSFGTTNLVFTANVSLSKPVNASYYCVPPVSGNLPSGILSISSYYWIISDSGIAFSNGYIKVPLNTLGGVTDSSKLRWLKRSYAGDNWTDIGGVIQSGYLVNTIPFNSFSEFAVASQDSQPLQSTNIKITLIPEGFYDVLNNRLYGRDTVKVYLREITTPFAFIDSATAVIDSLSFTGFFEFKKAPSGTYYIIVKHRNTIETWSKAGGIAFTKYTSMVYDYSVSQSNAYGSNQVLKGTKWCLYSGDVNQDGTIDLNDIIPILSDYDNLDFHIENDLNMDGTVDLNDAVFVLSGYDNLVGVVMPATLSTIKEKRKNINVEKSRLPDKNKNEIKTRTK